jgi:hypothetical protein
VAIDVSWIVLIWYFQCIALFKGIQEALHPWAQCVKTFHS